MKIAIGNDQHGYAYKKMIVDTFKDVEFVDVGADNGKDAVDYPAFAEKVASKVAAGEVDRGILVCGTGIGMAIAANKVKGCYAAVCHDVYSTERSILSNNANVLCMGALVIGPKTAETLVKQWLGLTFDTTSASAKKVEMIKKMEAAQ